MNLKTSMFFIKCIKVFWFNLKRNAKGLVCLKKQLSNKEFTINPLVKPEPIVKNDGKK